VTLDQTDHRTAAFATAKTRHVADAMTLKAMSDPYEREAAKAAIKVLQRELAEAKNKIERQGARIKYLEGATNHATGTPLTKALEQLDEMRIDRDEWKAVSEGRLLGSIDKVAQLERELADMTKRRDELLASLEKVVQYLSPPASAD
jgi:predicted RNase H-like nuclease (RuvC/YqgF family)